MKSTKHIGAAIAIILAAAMLSGCSNSDSPQTGNSSQTATSTDAAATDVVLSKDEMFTSRDMEIGYDEDNATIIKLNGNSAECSSSAVEISNNTITIKDEGTFILSGKLSDGAVIIDAGKKSKPQLVLNGAEINSSSSAAIYVKKADKVFITLATDTDNVLTSSGEFVAIDDNNIDAAVFSKDDITLNGMGSLTVSCFAGHGIVSKNDLVITSGNYSITSAKHGLSAKGSIRIADGKIEIAANKDGIKAENDDDTSLGFVYVTGGELDITAEGDGISSGIYAQIDSGSFKVTTGKSAAENSTTSMKGIKAGGKLTINGGSFTIDSADDSIHSNADITVLGGKYTLSSGDDGIHADNTLTVAGGEIDIKKSYEGLEGLTVNITGGTISLKADDDGINAAGGNDQSGFGGRRGKDSFGANSNAEISISGGTINVNASGDGVDSNGKLTVSGGYVYISGPSNGGNGAIDYETEGSITGGTVVAAGDSQMAMNFSSSTQGSILINVENQQANTQIKLTDSNGSTLISYEAEKAYSSVVLSCPEIKQGEKYTVTAGTFSQEITMDKLIYGESNGFGGGGFGGGHMKDHGSRPNFNNSEIPNRPNKPESGAIPDMPDFPGMEEPPEKTDFSGMEEPPEKPYGAGGNGDRREPPSDRDNANNRDNPSNSASQNQW